jgi:hypothetical protein
MKNHSSPEPAAHSTWLSPFQARTSATPAPDILQQKCCRSHLTPEEKEEGEAWNRERREIDN